MKCKLRQKIPKCRTKKGLSLVELIVGVTIIAMVLASASGVIVTGYKTTIDNAERNKAAASSASMNEIILKAVKNCGFSSQDEAESQFFSDDDHKIRNLDESVHAAVKKMYSQIYYQNKDGSFLAKNGDYQYMLNTAATRALEEINGSEVVLSGVEITTAVAVVGGFEEIVSFVPYLDQDDLKGG